MLEPHPNVIENEGGHPAFVVLPFGEFETLKARAELAEDEDFLPTTPDEIARRSLSGA